MSERPAPALLEALALLRAPRRPRLRASDRLPEGILQLIRIAAGEQESSNRAALACGETIETMRDAATFYIQQVLFAPESDSFRVLGVDSSADDERIREHYRWLARWLHPDRNADAWEVVFAERVSQAWQDLRTPERRLRYEQAATTPINAGPSERDAFREPAALLLRRSEPVPQQRMDLRWLPSAILGSLGIAAVAGLALIVAVRMADNRRESLATAGVPAEILPVQLSGSGVNAPRPAASAESRSGAAIPLVDRVAQAPAEPPEPLVSPAIAADSAQLAVEEEYPALAAAPAPVEPEPKAPAKPVALPAAKPVTIPVAKAVAKVPIAKPLANVRTATAPKAVPAPSQNTPKPAATAIAVAARPPTPPAKGERDAQAKAPQVGTRDANRLLKHFSRAYRDGDLSGMRALFSDDALGPRGGVDVIISDYQRVFKNSRERSLDVRDVSWFVTGDTLTIIASFKATVTSGRFSRTRRTRGDLRLDLRREKDQWQIYRLQHDERPG